MTTTSAKGVNGSIEFDGQFVTITRKGFGNRGSKSVPIASIGAVQVKPPSTLVNGFIQFSVAGEVTRSSGGVGRMSDAANDENAVIFTKKQGEQFELLRAAVLEAQAARK